MRRNIVLFVLIATLAGCGDRSQEDRAPQQAADETVADSLDLSSLSLKQLHDRMQLLTAKSRQLSSDMQRDVDDTKRRLGSRVNDPSSNAEAERIINTWPPQMQKAEQDMKATMDEIRKRCPNGATMNSAEQRCN